jgi:threonine dehydrogenase-like Zn-dependent dehydrogenase
LAPDTNLVVLPQSIDFNLASRFGYIGTSFAALKRVDTGPGKTLLINGVTGTLGYAAVAIALGLGCTRILGIGRNKERLAEVAGLGKNNRVVTRSSEDDGDIAEWIKEQTHGLGPDVLYDCLGVGGDAGGTMKLINTVKTGGSAILAAGGAEGDLTQTYAEAMQHQVSIVGSNWFSGDHIEELVDLVDAGVIDFGYLSHKVFPLKEVNEAFKFVGDRPGGAVNVVVQPQGKMSGD